VNLRRICVCFGLCGSLLSLAGCEDWDVGGMGGSDRYREDFHYSYPLNPGATVQVDNFNGSVEIAGWDKNTVDIDGTKYASSEDRMQQIRIDVSPSPGSVAIRTTRPLDRLGNRTARFASTVSTETRISALPTAASTPPLSGAPSMRKAPTVRSKSPTSSGTPSCALRMAESEPISKKVGSKPTRPTAASPPA
jgi:hypothetical protein